MASSPAHSCLSTLFGFRRRNAEIAAALAISPNTVKNHVQKILRKMDAENRAQAVARAQSLNLFDERHGPSRRA